MEVGNPSEVCSNLPAEWTSPENGWRLSEIPILNHRVKFDALCVGGRADCAEVLDVSLHGTVSSADLGGSSNYSNENFED
jgi:hypothetical protein